jgi:hypothetical protein
MDVIASVDGAAVRGRSLQDLRDLILGAPGSTIALSFMRKGNLNAASMEVFEVKLMRGSPQYLAALSAPAPQRAASPVTTYIPTAPVESPSVSATTQALPSPQSFAIPIPDTLVSPPPSFSYVPAQQPQSQGHSQAELVNRFIFSFFQTRFR